MKAGAFTPAIRRCPCAGPTRRTALNEGGGLHPRNPLKPAKPAPTRNLRSMKAGAFTPAIHESPAGVARDPSPLNEGGGLHPRNPHHPRLQPSPPDALNEGGGLHPRNPVRVQEAGGLCDRRSMKAGAFTPAIRHDLGAGYDPGPRSMKAGAFTPAIPVGGCRRGHRLRPLNEGGGLHPRNPPQSRRLGGFDNPRSMKAGAFTPAIRRWRRTSAPLPGTLNEGGGLHPRNPPPPPGPAGTGASLNEGGGLHPRNPGTASVPQMPVLNAQ